MLRPQNGPKRHWGSALFAASLAAWVSFFGLLLLSVSVQGVLQSFGLAPAGTPLQTVFVFSVFGVPVVLAVCFVIGIPALALAEWLKLRKWWQWTITGVIVGALLAALIVSASKVEFNVSLVAGIGVLMITGAAAASAALMSLWLDRHQPGRKFVETAE